MPDDQALLLSYARSRDAEAFTQLVERYSSLVFSVASRVTGNITVAEDITQECFFALARQAATIKGSLPSWLHRVAMNLSVTVIRNETARQRHEAQASLPSESACESTWKQIAPLLDAALALLSDDLREPLVQHFFLGRTQTQVAENLHIGQATVSRRLQEGIETLREHLKKAGVVCGSAALSTTLLKNASAAVPSRLYVSLVKIALAGPTNVAATASITAIIIAKAKLIGVIAVVVIVGAVLAYNLAPLLHRGGIPASISQFTPRPYLSKLDLKGNGYTQDSFSLAFQAAAKVLGRDADYESIYALSTNAFCPAIEDSGQNSRGFWHIQAWLGDTAIHTLCARYGLVAKKLDQSALSNDKAAYRRVIIPIINQEMQSGNVVLILGGWQDGLPGAGIITDAQANDAIFGATLNGRQDNPLIQPIGVWSLSPAAVTLTPHEANIAMLRWAVARIRGQSPFEARLKSVYGLKALDVWIKAMSETPGFCPWCARVQQNKHVLTEDCAYVNALTTYNAAAVAARYLRRITPDFPPAVQSYLQSAAARYDRIALLLTPALSETGPDSYANVLDDLSRQKAHVANVLYPIKSEYSAIAQDFELALTILKQQP
jgi:RNA polymerase sigma factor (sigma-70 family)